MKYGWRIHAVIVKKHSLPDKGSNQDGADGRENVGHWPDWNDAIAQAPFLGVSAVPVIVNDGQVDWHSDDADQGKGAPHQWVDILRQILAKQESTENNLR